MFSFTNKATEKTLDSMNYILTLIVKKKQKKNGKRNVTQRTFTSNIISAGFKRKKVHSKSIAVIDCICEP